MEIHEQRNTLGEEETVETCDRDIIRGCPEREGNEDDKECSKCQTTYRSKQHGIKVEISAEEKTCQWADGEGEPSKPCSGVIGLCTLIALAGIDDQGTGEHHLGQSEESPKQEPLENDDRQLQELTEPRVEIIEREDECRHHNDRPDTDMIAPEPLHEV